MAWSRCCERRFAASRGGSGDHAGRSGEGGGPRRHHGREAGRRHRTARVPRCQVKQTDMQEVAFMQTHRRPSTRWGWRGAGDPHCLPGASFARRRSGSRSSATPVSTLLRCLLGERQSGRRRWRCVPCTGIGRGGSPGTRCASHPTSVAHLGAPPSPLHHPSHNPSETLYAAPVGHHIIRSARTSHGECVFRLPHVQLGQVSL